MTENKKQLHKIGKVHSSQGVRGQIFVWLLAKDTPWIKKWKELLLTTSETQTDSVESFTIKKCSRHAKQGKEGWVLDLEGVVDKNKADELVKKWIWIPQEFLVSQKGETIYLREIKNFAVVDKTRGEVGTIIDFSSNGPQDLICIQTATKVYDVPLVKPFIEKIDLENKKIFMDIPLGLLEED